MKKTSVLAVFCVTLFSIVAAAAPPSLSQGNYMLVSDWEKNRILRFDAATGNFLDVFVANGSGTLTQPAGMVLDPQGNLLVSSTSNHKVLKYDGNNGSFLGVVASDIGIPVGLQFGPDGFLYVASRGGNSVYRVNETTGVAQTFAHADDAWDLEFGPDGNLYVSTLAAFRILRFNGSTGQMIDTFALSPPNEYATGFEFADEHLYLSTYQGNSIRKFDASTGASQGLFISTAVPLPIDLAFGPDRNMYVAFERTGQILRYDRYTGQSLGVFATAPDFNGATMLLFTQPVPVPEPATCVLFTIAIFGSLPLRRRVAAA